jgi:lactate racemase
MREMRRVPVRRAAHRPTDHTNLQPEGEQAVGLFVGEPEAALRAGAAVTEQVYGLPLDRPFEIVIASCGGDPKDICLYQAQKGLNMASQCAEEGGKILLLAACGQGVGDPHYEKYVCQFSCPEDQMREFAEQGFRMGAHKAFLFSRTLTRFTVVVDSEMDARSLAQCHLTKGDAQATLDAWLATYPEKQASAHRRGAQRQHHLFLSVHNS